MLKSFRILAAFTAVAASLSSCSVDTTIPDEVPIEQTDFASALAVDLAASTRTANGVYYRDLTVGTGAVVAVGQTLNVRYTGWLSSGRQIDSNVGASTPFTFQLLTSQVIGGWVEGLPGMRVGGRRQLVIPPSLGYGVTGLGPVPPNAVLVFVVDVVSAQ